MKGMKGQSSAEFSTIFSISIFLTLILFVIAILNLNALSNQKTEEAVNVVLDEWAYIASDIWMQGNGSSYEWKGYLPGNYNKDASSIDGKHIVIEINGVDYERSFTFNVTGNLPESATNITLDISNNGEEVVFTFT